MTCTSLLTGLWHVLSFLFWAALSGACFGLAFAAVATALLWKYVNWELDRKIARDRAQAPPPAA
jgi:hypothetical protein